MPWKNGGGVTTEIAVSPEGASMDAFDWRVSMADVSSDSPFSLFPGVDRTLSVLIGTGIDLDFGANGSVSLDGLSDPYRFAADTPVSGRLHSGPIRDLNVMSRRGRVEHRVSQLVLQSARSIPVTGDILMLIASGGATRIACSGKEVPLSEGDALLIFKEDGAHVDVLTECSSMFAIDFWFR